MPRAQLFFTNPKSIADMKNKRAPMTRSFGHRSLKNLLTSVGARLAELRIEKGFTSIKNFTEHYDLPGIQYWRIEKGKANITLKSLSRILEIHKLKIHDFFCLMDEGTA